MCAHGDAAPPARRRRRRARTTPTSTRRSPTATGRSRACRSPPHSPTSTTPPPRADGRPASRSSRRRARPRAARAPPTAPRSSASCSCRRRRRRAPAASSGIVLLAVSAAANYPERLRLLRRTGAAPIFALLRRSPPRACATFSRSTSEDPSSGIRRRCAIASHTRYDGLGSAPTNMLAPALRERGAHAEVTARPLIGPNSPLLMSRASAKMLQKASSSVLESPPGYPPWAPYRRRPPFPPACAADGVVAGGALGGRREQRAIGSRYPAARVADVLGGVAGKGRHAEAILCATRWRAGGCSASLVGPTRRAATSRPAVHSEGARRVGALAVARRARRARAARSHRRSGVLTSRAATRRRADVDVELERLRQGLIGDDIHSSRSCRRRHWRELRLRKTTFPRARGAAGSRRLGRRARTRACITSAQVRSA